MGVSREDLLKHWECVVAYKNGSDIQYRYSGGCEWKAATTPCWLYNLEYRVKPEIRLVTIYIYEDGYVAKRTPSKAAQRSHGYVVARKTVEYIYGEGLLKEGSN